MVIFSIMGLAIYKDVLQNLFGEAISVTMELLGYTKDKVLWLSGNFDLKSSSTSLDSLINNVKYQTDYSQKLDIKYYFTYGERLT